MTTPTPPVRRVRRWPLVAPLSFVGVTLLPLFNVPFHSDAEHLPYEDLANSPDALLGPSRQALSTIETYLHSHGTFRPLGRAFRGYATSWTVRIADTVGVAPHVIWGLMRCLFGVAAAYGVVLLARAFVEAGRPAPVDPAESDLPESDQVRADREALDRLAWPVCGAFSLGLVAAGLTGSPVFFPSSYLVVVAIVGATVRWAGRPALWSTPLRPDLRTGGRAVVALIIGAALAMWGELAAIAVPLLALWVAMLLWQRRRRFWQTATSVGGLGAALVVAGFGLVSVASRLSIANACAQPGAQCYRYSEIGLSSRTPSVLVSRVWSSVPPIRIAWAFADVAPFVNLGALVVGIGLVAAALVVVARRSPAGSSASSTGSTRWAAARLALAGAALVVLSELVPAVSLGFQQAVGRVGMGQSWRNSTVSAAGWALILAAAWMLGADRVSPTLRRLAVAGVGAVWVLVLVTNAGFARAANSTESGRINASIAEALVDTDGSTQRNCDLVAAWANLAPTAGGSADPAERFDFLNRRLNGARAALGEDDFCATAGADGSTPDQLEPGDPGP